MSNRIIFQWISALLHRRKAGQRAARGQRRYRNKLRRTLRVESLEDRSLLSAAGIITTAAGTGTLGYSGDGGQATVAALKAPARVAVDAVGDIFIADTTNSRIREINASTGIITTVAGNGTAGSSGDNGLATAAELDFPYGVAVDGSGDIFIADTYNGRIREVNASTHIITTVAGGGSNAGTDGLGDGGLATAAQLNFPTGVAVDAGGDLFIADNSNNCIREVNASTHIITTVAGGGSNAGTDGLGDGGPATAAKLNSPGGVAVDGRGDLFIADTDNERIREVNASTGVITTVAGDGTAGYTGDSIQATAAELYYPQGVAVDRAGDLFIADTYNQRIREVNASTQLITTVAGNGYVNEWGAGGYSGDNGPATTAEISSPFGVALQANGNLFIADTGNNRVRAVASVGNATTNTTSTALTASALSRVFGQAETLTATVTGMTGTPTGTVTFTNGGAFIGTANLANGTAAVTVNSLSAGTDTVTAVYSGDFNDLGSSSAGRAISVSKATPSVAVSDAGGTYSGATFPATATVAGVVPGVDNSPASSLETVTPTINYYAGSLTAQQLATASPLGGAPQNVGTYTVAAAFAGSADYVAATSSPAVFAIAAPSLAAPAGLTASAGTFNNQVALSWNAVSGATGYLVYRSTTNNSAAAGLAYVTAATGLNDSLVTPGTIYYYWLESYDTVAGSYFYTSFGAGASGYAAPTPAAPAGLTASDGTSVNHVALAWNAVSSASGYLVFRSTTNNSATASLAYSTSSTTQNDAAVTPGTTYYYWLESYEIVAGSYYYSAFGTGASGYAANTAPASPTGLTASAGTYTNQVALNWNAVPGSTGYLLYRSTTNNSAAAELSYVTATTSLNDSLVTPGTTYYYWLESYVAVAGSYYYSSFGTGASGYAASPTIAAPTGLTASQGTSSSQVALSWNAVPGAAGYLVYRSTTNNTAAASLSYVTAATSLNDSLVTPGTTYYYWLESYEVVAGSYYYSSFGIGASGYASPTLAAPTDLTASAGAYTDHVALSWNAVSGATGYLVYRSTTNNSATASLSYVTSSTTQDDTYVTPGVTYYYWLESYEVIGGSYYYSGFSTVASGYAASTAIAAPTGLTASQGTSSSQVSLNWNAVPGVNGYLVYRSTTNDSSTASLSYVTSSTTQNDTSVTPGTTYYYWLESYEVIAGSFYYSSFSAVASGFAT